MSGTPALQPGEDPHQILGLAPDATNAEITRAYRRLLRQHHPDTAPGHTPLDQHRLGQILAAYRHLRRQWTSSDSTAGPGTPVTVRHHTADVARPAPPPPRNPDDVWIGDKPPAPASGDRRRIRIAQRGRDTTAAVTITTGQATTGTVVTVAVPDDRRGFRNIRVHIPAGTVDGQTLRIPGHGTPGHNGGPGGDLHLTVYTAGTP